MKKSNNSLRPAIFIPLLLLTIGTALSLATQLSRAEPNTAVSEESKQNQTAIFAGGCFWCIEADFEKLKGVSEVISGYSGGSADTATYKQVTHKETGHFEVVQVSYDPQKISYAELVEYFWVHIDPTDPNGQFCDKGSSYRSAIFYGSEQEKNIVEASLEKLNESKPFEDPIVTTIAEAQPFYIAEGYHQDYYKKNPIRYNYYRNGCRRDKRIEQLWGEYTN